MSRFSKSVMTSLNEIPSGGMTNCGIAKFGRLADVLRNQLDPNPRPDVRTTARSMTFSSSRTLPGQSYAVSKSSASGVSSRPVFVLLAVLGEEVPHE